MKVVEEHIQMVMRLLATQFENEREDKDFDSNIRILQHAQEIKKIFQRRTFDLKAHLQKLMKIKTSTLPVTEEEMKDLEDELLYYADQTKQAVTLRLPMKSEESCWNSILPQEMKDKKIFVGKCGECQVQHEFPRCDQCRKPRQKSGPCSECGYIKKKEDTYKGYCGNCFQIHEFPNCVQCQYYRIKPGRCTNCGVIGPDNDEWIYTCLGQDAEYEELINPILEARKKKVDEERKKFITYKNCPLCRGYFHSAKACIFRTHVKHFNIMKRKMEMFADEVNTTTQMVIPTTDSEESDDSEDEEAYDCESSDGGDECYMIVTRHRQNSDEEDMDEDDEDSFNSKIKEVIKNDKILTIVTRLREEDLEEDDQEEDQEEEDQEEEEEDDQEYEDQDEEDQDGEDPGREDQNQAEDEDQEEDPTDNSEDDNSDQQQDDQEDNQMDTNNSEHYSVGCRLSTTPDTRKKVFGNHTDETACELNKKNFELSICKILPDTAEFPEDIFNIEGCIWCGSKGHDVYNCLGYATWLGDLWLAPLEERRLTYPQRQKRIEEMLKIAKEHYHNPRRPWELYTGLDDGEYLTEKGVKILIENKKIMNLIPKHLQTTTTIYPDLPTAEEMGRMLHLSTTTRPIAQTTVMEELCNQAVTMKEDMIELEIELKRSLGLQIAELKKEVRKELCAISTMIDDKVSSLPQQLVSFREYLSKSLANLHQRSLQSDLTLVETYRSLSEAKSAESCMTWRSTICESDPAYHIRGRWRQLSDRLNNLVEFTIRSNLVVPTTGRKHAEELREISTLIGEVMQQMFFQNGILDKEDLMDVEDFLSFQETICRSMEIQAISPNQVCNFIQQMLYYEQCEKKHFTAYMDMQRQIEVFIGILIQTTLKTWERPGNCKCNFEEKLNCRHSQKYSILRQHFPTFGLLKMEDLVDLLDTISNQTCDCINHAAFPMHGPSKYIKSPIPTYQQLQELHLQHLPGLHKPNLDDYYVRAIMSWIYSRLFQYLTPYSDPSMNREPEPVKCSEWEFYHAEKQFLENRLSIMNFEAPLSTIWEKVLELGDLKKSYCQCKIHQEDRETNLLYQLKLHNTCGNRKLVNRILKSKPFGFTALISSCMQIIGTSSQCNLLLYEVTPTTAGTFEAVELHSRPQPHQEMRNNYSDLSDNTMVHVCRNNQEELSIYNLLAQVKGEEMVEVATDGVADFLDSEEESDSCDSTAGSTGSTIPDLVDSFNSCHII